MKRAGDVVLVVVLVELRWEFGGLPGGGTGVSCFCRGFFSAGRDLVAFLAIKIIF